MVLGGNFYYRSELLPHYLPGQGQYNSLKAHQLLAFRILTLNSLGISGWIYLNSSRYVNIKGYMKAVYFFLF